MPMPQSVAFVWQSRGYNAFQNALKKAAKTKAKKRERKKAQEEKEKARRALLAAEEESAEIWYQQRRAWERDHMERLQPSPAAARRDDLLPEDF